MSLTSAQQQAVAAGGNVLVVAGAGTGKTKTLVERCLHCLLAERPRASLEEILMVTFTDAAAAEMRQRIRARLEDEFRRNPGDFHWAEQLALFDTAHIGTLHGFCLRLVRQQFYGLQLDPQVTVMPEEEATLLAHETLDQIIQSHYAGETPASEAVRQLVQVQGRGWDRPVRALVLRLHHYTQTLPDPAGWFAAQLAAFRSPEPMHWQVWLLQAVCEWRERWLPALPGDGAGNAKAAACAAILTQLPPKPSHAEAAAILDRIEQTDQDWPRGKKTQWREPLKDFFDDAAFLLSLVRATGAGDPLAEDWGWVRGQMTTLLELARQFGANFKEAKRELGVVDFHDLEQYALDVLWDRAAGQPTAAAHEWRRKLRFVFVDEYQDINAAQDKIIQALSRGGAAANRFLVGDMKQSIYRFRLADPSIFRQYSRTWRDGEGTVIPLADNFRSRESLLGFINAVFAVLMRPELGGMTYDSDARLRFGNASERHLLSLEADASPCVELHLHLKGQGNSDTGGENDDESGAALASVAEVAAAEKEARIVALRLLELKTQRHQIWDDDCKSFRPVEWRDMAVLLRSPANKAENYAKEFDRAGVPLIVVRGGFYKSLEVLDLLSLLQLLDNPLQDLPALAVLHSPLVGLTLDELARIHLALPKERFWATLLRWHARQRPKADVRSAKPSSASLPHPAPTTTPHKSVPAEQPPELESVTFRKVDTFLTRFAHWRRLARQVLLSRCLEAVLAETHYAEWLLTQPRGEQRHANVQRLLGLAQQFDEFQRQGLFRFLQFVEAQQLAETEPETACLTDENAVSLMSIHQSKGLEFPVVVVADLAKRFNDTDLRANIILDEIYGLCPQVQPPRLGQRYPSLPYWLARRRQWQELLGEELRLLYVAMTRARDRLILTGTVAEKKLSRWCSAGDPSAPDLLKAHSYLDWLGAWFARSVGRDGGITPAGENSLLRWQTWDDGSLLKGGQPAAYALPKSPPSLDVEAWAKLQRRFAWQYPFAAATREPAKQSVTGLRRRLEEATDLAAEFKVRSSEFRVSKLSEQAPEKLSAAEIGTAHHTFLQQVMLERTGSVEELRREAQRLQEAGTLSWEEAGALDLDAIGAFWQSELGQRFQKETKDLRRELAFTARFSPAELANVLHAPEDPLPADEFVVVQGVVDLAVILPEKIWLVDFKTDQLTVDALPEKVKSYEPQLRLYALALSRIYQRPVTELWLHFFSVRRSMQLKEQD